MIGIDVLLAAFISDEPRRVIDELAVQVFIESRRSPNHGPGKVLAMITGPFDSDPYPDRLVVYTYERDEDQDNVEHGVFAVAFLTENFETTEALFIPETELVPESLREYSSAGNELTITGQKHLPGDSRCCPSAVASITLSVVDGTVVILKGRYDRRSNP